MSLTLTCLTFIDHVEVMIVYAQLEPMLYSSESHETVIGVRVAL